MQGLRWAEPCLRRTQDRPAYHHRKQRGGRDARRGKRKPGVRVSFNYRQSAQTADPAEIDQGLTPAIKAAGKVAAIIAVVSAANIDPALYTETITRAVDIAHVDDIGIAISAKAACLVFGGAHAAIDCSARVTPQPPRSKRSPR